MDSANSTRLIEAYYNRSLKGNDKRLFKQMMSEDPSFKQEVKAYKQIFRGLDNLHLEQFQKNLNQYESQHQNKTLTNSNIRPLRKVYLAAAAIALLICATLGYNILMPSPFDQHFQASKSIGVHMESTRNGDHKITEPELIKKAAFSAYQDKEYEKTITLLKDYLHNFPEVAAKDYQSILVLGVSQLASDQAEKATKHLEYVMNSKDSSYRQEAEWMWVLAQYKLGKEASTKTVLEEIAHKTGHIHSKAAAELLSNL